MNKTYEKPVISIDAGLAEGVYAASGDNGNGGNISVADAGVWDRWEGGGKHGFIISWSGVTSSATVVMNFNDTVDEVAANGSNVSASASGNTVTITFGTSADNPIYVGCHLNHGTSVDSLSLSGYTSSIN